MATACPSCILTLEDAVKSMGVEERIKICDIMELVAEVME
jgi:Fe-S oxidoreductase